MRKPQAERLQDINARIERRRLTRQAFILAPVFVAGVFVGALALAGLFAV